jgi:hypothetical protein
MSTILSSVVAAGVVIFNVVSVGAQSVILTHPPGPTSSRSTNDKVRKSLLQARDQVWRAFFQKDQDVLERLLGPELIAIQESESQWDNRTHLIEVAKEIIDAEYQLHRLEFPRTEIQIFGKTAILYYSYVFETGFKGKASVVSAVRGTEIFVLRKGRWVDVGWHLDNGAFRLKNGVWTKVELHPEPTVKIVEPERLKN